MWATRPTRATTIRTPRSRSQASASPRSPSPAGPEDRPEARRIAFVEQVGPRIGAMRRRGRRRRRGAGWHRSGFDPRPRRRAGPAGRGRRGRSTADGDADHALGAIPGPPGRTPPRDRHQPRIVRRQPLQQRPAVVERQRLHPKMVSMVTPASSARSSPGAVDEDPLPGRARADHGAAAALILGSIAGDPVGLTATTAQPH